MRLMYGTAWKEDDTKRCVVAAIRAGFRAIDTANQRKHYFEAGVGDALVECWNAGVVRREDLFLQTKFTYARGQDHRLPFDPRAPYAEQVRSSFASSLEHLHTDRIDSLVLHGPASGSGLTDADWQVWQTMESLHRENRVGAIGISNVRLEQLEALCAKAAIQPSYVQNRCYARDGWDRSIRAYCQSRKIVYQGFSLLTANPEVFRRANFQEIVRRVKKTPEQVVFRFAIQVGMLPLTGTTDEAHMREDLAIDDFELTAAEVAKIES